ncbi:MAG: hypothetical protein RR739_04210, partial [Clostridia bacterium]
MANYNSAYTGAQIDEAARRRTLVGGAAPTSGTAGQVGQLYLAANGSLYKCTAASGGVYTWVMVGEASLGETATTAYRGDRGKTAYDHSQATHAPTTQATPTAPGIMSAADKGKLDGVAAGANNYAHPVSDGTLHVPATWTNSSGKVLKAGATAGSAAWGTMSAADVGAEPVGTAGTNVAAHNTASEAHAARFNSKANVPIATTGTLTVAGWVGAAAPYTQALAMA